MDFVRLVALLKALTGKEWTEEKAKKLDADILKRLVVMDGYGVGEFADLGAAVGGFIKDLEGAAETPTDPPATSDAGGESEDTALAALKDARTKIDSLISERETPETPVEKQLREVQAQLANLTKALGKEAQGNATDIPLTPEQEDAAAQAKLDAFDARLATVEKNSGVVQGMNEGGDPTDVNKGGGPEVDHYKTINID